MKNSINTQKWFQQIIIIFSIFLMAFTSAVPSALAYNSAGYHDGFGYHAETLSNPSGVGNVYSYNDCRITGWAVDYDTPTTPRNVLAYYRLGNTWYYPTVTANLYRSDLAASACPGLNGNCAFSYNIAHLINPNTNTLTKARIITNEGIYVDLKATPRTIKCVNTGNPPQPGYLSAPAGNGSWTNIQTMTVNFGYNYGWGDSRWNGAYSGVQGYNVYYGTDPNGITNDYIAVGRSDLSYSRTITAPSVGTYYLRVNLLAKNGNNAGWVTVYTHKYDNLAPNTPSSPATESHGVINNTWTAINTPSFTWNAVADNGVAGIKGYNVYWGTSSSGTSTTFQSGRTKSVTISSSGTYYLRVRSIDNANNYSSWATLFTYKYDGLAPNLVSAPAIESHGIQNNGWSDEANPSFTWSAPNDNGGSGVAGYNVYWGTSSTATSTSYQTSRNISPGTLTEQNAYYLRVRAKDNVGIYAGWNTIFVYNYDYGAPDEVTIPVTESHGVTNGSWINNVNAPSFTWNTPSDMGHAPVSGYNVYWGTSSTATTANDSTTSNTFSPPIITEPMTEKYLRLQTVNESGIQSTWVTAFTFKYDNVPPNTMPVITETHGVISGQDVYDETPSFTWSVPSTSGAPVVGYTLYWGTNPAGETPSNYQTATSYTPPTITQNAVHYLRMKLKDAAGNFSAWNTVFEYKYSAEQVTKYYNLGPVTGMSSDGVYYTLVSDQVSSTALVVDASGNKVAETRYFPFGEERYTSGTSPTDKTYTGQRAEDFGLMDYNARYYSLLLGKFISADTIIPDPGNVLAWDRYGYAYNNAIRYNDPTGHCIDGLTTIPCLMALITVAGFAGGAAIYEFNVSGNSWWESPEDALATAQAGIEGAVLAVGAALTAGQTALMLPDAAMFVGANTNNVEVYSWGATQNGLLPTNQQNILINGSSTTNYVKTEFQSRTVYQRNDIDWDFVDHESGLTNLQLVQGGKAPFGPDGEKINLHHLLQMEPGPMAEVPASLHRNKALHGLVGSGQSFRNEPVLNRQFNKFRVDYWKWRGENIIK